jgi:hypothetical protein
MRSAHARVRCHNTGTAVIDLLLPIKGGAIGGGAAAATAVLLPAAILLACPPCAHYRREAAGPLAVQVLRPAVLCLCAVEICINPTNALPMIMHLRGAAVKPACFTSWLTSAAGRSAVTWKRMAMAPARAARALPSPSPTCARHTLQQMDPPSRCALSLMGMRPSSYAGYLNGQAAVPRLHAHTITDLAAMHMLASANDT